jgi:hypothetical protein
MILKFKGARADERPPEWYKLLVRKWSVLCDRRKRKRKANSQFGLWVLLCFLFIFMVPRVFQKREVKQRITWTTPPYATPTPALVPMLFDKTTGLYGPITDHHSKNQIEVWENPDLIKNGKYVGANSESTPTASE